ncbi:universal stress protein [Phenylobacterium sp.]|jgi:nucleotide-binding universal stress UspA family protein|uniref:universal stress protein n=1 Tax=Phenylobacterium sp. TaxID=1871053 RepID=UPI002C22AB6C|nr:universal stress protein [Phenylobacterium sp.]
MYKHILISTDGSEVGQKGLIHGLDLAKGLGAQVTVVTVTERFPAFPDSVGYAYAMSDSLMADYGKGQSEAANAILTAAKTTAEQRGVTIETVHVRDAQPAEAIIDTAKARGCDLITMASHGRRGLGRLMLGSVASEVLTHSAVPVLVVR